MAKISELMRILTLSIVFLFLISGFSVIAYRSGSEKSVSSICISENIFNSNITPSQASSSPPKIIYQAPVTIDNTQSTATPNQFQQMINLNETTYSSQIFYCGSSANFEFSYANNSIIPSWIESNNSGLLTIWLKLYSIPASSSITIYINFASLTTNLLSSSGTTGIGEAPQLSPSYGEYNNAKKVFPYAISFTNSSDSNKLIFSPDTNYVIDDGLTIYGGNNANTTFIPVDYSPYTHGLIYSAYFASNSTLGHNPGSLLSFTSGSFQISGLTYFSGHYYMNMNQNLTADLLSSLIPMSNLTYNDFYEQVSDNQSEIIYNGHAFYFNITNGANISGQTNIGLFEQQETLHVKFVIVTNRTSIMPFVAFGSAQRVFEITFTESGLPTGATWNVTFNGITLSSTIDTLTFIEPNGTYSYVISSKSGYMASTYSGVINVNGSPVSNSITWKIITYLITITENGIPNGTFWSATLTGTTFSGQYINVTLSSTTHIINFNEPNGTYLYTVHLPSGFIGNTMGIISVSGQSITSLLKAEQFYNYIYIMIIVAIVIILAAIGAVLAMRRRKN